MEQKKIDLWVEYDSYGSYVSGKNIKCDTYEEAIKELSNFENNPDCFSEYKCLQISIMITDYNQTMAEASKLFYDVEDAINYCKTHIGVSHVGEIGVAAKVALKLLNLHNRKK